MRAAVFCCLALAAPARAQTIQVIDDAKLPRFEVVSVKAGDPSADRAMFGTPPGRFNQENLNLVSALGLAFGVRPGQIDRSTLPDLIQGDRFTINAKAPDGAPRSDLPLMVRAILVDRFKMRYHIDRRDEDGYALTVARRDGRLGPNLHASPVDCQSRLAARGRGESVPPQPAGTVECGIRNGPGLINFGGMPIALLVQMLSNQTGRQVVDNTGLTGNFDVELRFTLESAGPPRVNPDGTAPPPSDAVSIFTAVQEALGLKLDRTKVTVDYLVVDHIERPEPD
jgi:uncharacterized protein (TIGR03435 family)